VQNARAASGKGTDDEDEEEAGNSGEDEEDDEEDEEDESIPPVEETDLLTCPCEMGVAPVRILCTSTSRDIGMSTHR
jgi:hypothetical protein